MRRRLALVPTVLLTSGCFVRPWTPAVSVAYWSEDPASAPASNLPTSLELASRWQLPPENPWARWQKMVLAGSLDAKTEPTIELPAVRDLEIVHRAEWAGARLASSGLPHDTLFVVDLRGAASVAFGASMSRWWHDRVANVLTFNNWPADNELIPAEETLAALLAIQPILPQGAPDAPSVPVFLLDAWRLAFREDMIDDDVTDNRYMLTQADFPDAATLRQRGITRVVYLVEDLDDTELVEDDCHATFAAWQEAGIALYMTDLAWALKNVPTEVRFGENLSDKRIAIQQRLTLADDPRFYYRAHGGFGGIYGRPWGAGFGPGGRGGYGGHGGG
jgi:hypothetical protein